MYTLLSIILIPLGIFFELDRVRKDRTKVPIILLHGWFTQNLPYFFLMRRLEKLGYLVCVPYLGLHIGDVEKITKKLEEYIKKNKLKNFIMVGHSYGGLIATNYYLKNKETVKKIITLGTPFYGAEVAKYGSFFSKGAEQMIPNSKFLNFLHRQEIEKEKIISLATPYDPRVPIVSTKLKGSKHFPVECYGHVQLIYSRKVFNKIKEVL